MTKHLWKVAAKKDSLWVKWIHVEKLKEGVCGKHHLRVILGNGANTYAWYDKWNAIGPLGTYITYRNIYSVRLSKDYTVAEVINNGNWCWPVEWYAKYPVLDQFQVPVLNADARDKVVWTTNAGIAKQITVRNVWKDICSVNPKVAWNSLVWPSQSIPRQSFVLWVTVQSRMMTQDRVLVWKPNEIMKCAMCQLCPDSHEHLFFKCTYTHKVWTSMQRLLNRKYSDNWRNVIEEMSKLPANNNVWSILRRRVCDAVVYFLWQERNARLFKKLNRDEETLLKIIKETIRL
ncbi:reverse transcriptase zinc-binding domain-containing protein [Tanacetum coccineum]